MSLKKVVAVLLLFAGQSVFAAQTNIDVKLLKAGDSTLEALGEIDGGDEIGYSAIREIKCLAPDFANKIDFSAKKSEGKIAQAMVLVSGSKIVIRRSALNDYDKRFKMNELVLISCE